MVLQKKTLNNIIQIGRKYWVIHSEYEWLEVLDLGEQIHYLI